MCTIYNNKQLKKDTFQKEKTEKREKELSKEHKKNCLDILKRFKCEVKGVISIEAKGNRKPILKF